jgi:TP901 family phage tail tape measure protein
MATDTSANIGIRVFLDDAASRGLYAINTQLGQAGTLARQAGIGFGQMSTQMAGLAVVSGLAVSFAGFAGAIVYSTIQAIQFSTTMLKIQRATGATSEEIAKLGGIIQTLAGSSIFGIKQIADGFVLLGQRGISAKDIINGVGLAGVQLAESIGVAPVDAMGLLGITMASMGIAADKAQATVDLLQYAFEHGIPSVTGLQQAITAVGGEAKLLHVPLDELITLLDFLTPALGSGAKAGTSLRQMLQALSSPSATQAAEMKKLGLSFYDSSHNAKDLADFLQELAVKLDKLNPADRAAAIKALFTIRGSMAASQIIPEIDKIMASLDKLRASNNNAGQAAKKAGDVAGSAAGLWSSMLTNIQSVATNIGGPFLALLQPTLVQLQSLSMTLLQMSQRNPVTLATFLALGAAVSGVGLIVAIAMSPFALFIGIMVGTIAVILAIVAAVMWMENNWQRVVAVLTQVWAVASRVLTVLGIIAAIIVGIKVAQLAIAFVQAIPAMVAFAATMFTQVIPALIANINQTAMMVARALIAASFNLSTIIPSLLATAAAWWANALAEMAALAPYILIAAVIAGAIIGLVLLIQHLGGLNAILKVGQAIWGVISQALMEAGAAIKGALMDALKQLQPVWNQLVQAFNQAKPFLMWLGIALGVIIAIAIAVFIGSIRAAINVISAFIVALIHIVSGIIQVVGGIIQFFMGFFQVLHGIFTGNGKEIQQGFKQMGDGLLNIIKGAWNAISAVFVGAFNIIKGFVTGFISGIIGFFQNLAGQLIHHSIIPDMLNAIISAILGFIPRAIGGFANFIGQMIAHAQSLPGKIMSAVGNLGNLLFNAGKNIVQGLINGFLSVVQNLYNTISNALNNVRNMFPHSPAKTGPLTDLHTWMPNVVKMLVDTTDQSAPSLHASMGRVAGTVKSGLASGIGGSSSGGGGETYNLQIDGRTFMSFFHSRTTGDLSANGVGRMQR